MLVLQPTPFCNISCSYCYLPHRSSKARMDEDTIARIFDQLRELHCLQGGLTILWHAGEPLTLGVKYYENAFALIRERCPPEIRLVHNFQTNGTLIDDKWCTFFCKHHVTVGLSIDGPSHLHDRHRRTRNNQGTFQLVKRAIGSLNQARIPFHVITVLTRDSLLSARDLFEFYLDIGATNVGFNIDEIEGDNDWSSLNTDHVDDDVRRFFGEMYDLCEAHPGRLRIREIDGAVHAIAHPESDSYGNPLAEPLRMLSVAANGDISTFSPELLGYGSKRHGSFAFGNVYAGGLSQMVRDPRYMSVDAEIRAGLAKCASSCEYFQLCRGGAPANKFFENGTFDSTETLFCRLTKKAVVDVVLQRLEVALAAS